MKEKDVNILTAITFLVFFFPQFQSQFGLLFEQILSILICAISFILFITNKRAKINTLSFAISILFMLLLIISLLRSLNILITNDLFELAKPVYFCSFFLLGYNIKWNNAKLRMYFSNLMALLLIAALIGIGESVNSSMNTIMTKIYKGDRLVLSHKAIFSFISPYTFGTVLLLPIFYYSTKITKTKNKHLVVDFIFFMMSFVCLILTQSRTLFVSFIVTFFIVFVMALYFKWYPYRKKVFAMYFIIFFVSGVFVTFSIKFIEGKLNYLFIGLKVFLNSLEHLRKLDIERLILSNSTLAIRYEQFLFAMEQQDRIPLIGVGIGKSVLMPETFYVMYYYRVGIIGMCIHFCLIMYTIYWSLYFVRKYSQLNTIKKDNCLMVEIFLAIAIYFISFFLDYFSSAVNDQTRSGFIFYILISIICYYKRHYRKVVFETVLGGGCAH